MTLKNYQKLKIAVVIIIAIVFSQGVIYKNYLIPISTLALGSLVLWYFRNQIQEVVADERDYNLAGRSALQAIQIYSWLAVIVMIILYAFRDSNVIYEPIAVSLAFSTCSLMFIYVLNFRFKAGHKKVVYRLLGVLIIIALIYLILWIIR